MSNERNCATPHDEVPYAENKAFNRLRQRVAELESQVEMLSTPHTKAWFEARHKERGERMKSMREWIENDPEDNGGVSFVQRHSAHNWFDPETGEPL